MNSFEKPDNMPYQDPVVIIEGIRAEIMATGAVDVEQEALNEIILELKGGKITEEEAIQKARTVQQNRQDYH